MKDWIKLLILNNVAHISNFLLNLVFFGCLQKCGFDWSNCSDKILKNKQIIEYTRFYSNNHKNGNNKIDKIAFATLAADTTTLKNTWSYKELHYAAISNARNCKMSHIGPFRLYILAKECLAVRLWEKKCLSIYTLSCSRYLSNSQIAH